MKTRLMRRNDILSELPSLPLPLLLEREPPPLNIPDDMWKHIMSQLSLFSSSKGEFILILIRLRGASRYFLQAVDEILKTIKKLKISYWSNPAIFMMPESFLGK